MDELLVDEWVAYLDFVQADERVVSMVELLVERMVAELADGKVVSKAFWKAHLKVFFLVDKMVGTSEHVLVAS